MQRGCSGASPAAASPAPTSPSAASDSIGAVDEGGVCPGGRRSPTAPALARTSSHPFIAAYFGVPVATAKTRRYYAVGVRRSTAAAGVRGISVHASARLVRHSLVAVEFDGIYGALLEQSRRLAARGDPRLPNCTVVALHAGEPGTPRGCVARCVLATSVVEPNSLLLVHVGSIARCADEATWYDELYNGGAGGRRRARAEAAEVKVKVGGEGSGILHQHAGKKHTREGDAAVVPPPDWEEEEAVERDAELLRIGVDPFKAVPLPLWPRGLPYYHGIGERHRSDAFPPLLGFPYNLLRLEPCAGLGAGQLQVTAAAHIPYGTCWLYTGYFADTALARAAPPKQPPQSEEEEARAGADKADETYAFGLSHTQTVYGQCVARYINHRYNFCDHGNVQFGVAHFPRVDERMAFAARDGAPSRGPGAGGAAVGKQQRHAASSSSTTTTTTTTKPRKRAGPQQLRSGGDSMLALPFFVACRDIYKDEQLLATTYGEAYDARLERAALCSDIVASARDMSLQLGGGAAAAAAPSHYRADYKAVLGPGEVVVRRDGSRQDGVRFFLVLDVAPCSNHVLLLPLEARVAHGKYDGSGGDRAGGAAPAAAAAAGEVGHLALHVPDCPASRGRPLGRGVAPPPGAAIAADDTVALLLAGIDYEEGEQPRAQGSNGRRRQPRNGAASPTTTTTPPPAAAAVRCARRLIVAADLMSRLWRPGCILGEAEPLLSGSMWLSLVAAELDGTESAKRRSSV